MKVFRNIAEVKRDQSLIGYVRPLQRAWDEFDLAAVVCVDGTPVLYHKISRRILSSDELKELHRLFWNQGIANVFLVIDPKSIYVFSGFVSPLRKSDILSAEVSQSPLVICEDRANFLQSAVDALYTSVANGEFYRLYTEKFHSKSSVDEYLTANLRALQELLTTNEDIGRLGEEDAHNLICRLLFACYLVDRQIVKLPATKKAYLHEALIERNDAEALEYLYKLFKSLKRQFNGSMFDQDLDVEKTLLTSEHMARIKTFLHGDEVGSQQATLGFWAYDFGMIPVETISGLYENFLNWEDKNLKGAYYTPRFLAEMTLDALQDNRKAWKRWRYLDPCCGSGIFLVSLFNRLVTAWELDNQDKTKNKNYYELKVEALLNILRTQIRGMDQKSSACTLACFSLYVALLDSFNPSDIQTYIAANGKLPKLFLRKNARPTGEHFIPVICEGDTLTSTRFEETSFDVAVGNPPWVDRGQKQLALQFLKRLDDLLKPNGQACLLLPSKLFLNNKTDSFQADWLRSHTLERVIQLADFRFILFPEAQCPCMIVHYRQKAPKDNHHEILYDTPKFNFSARRQGLIAITGTDRKSFPQGKITWLAAQGKAHIYWKRFLWGTARDQRLLEYLEQFPKLEDRTGGARSNKSWKKGQGVQPNTSGKCEKPKAPWWSTSHKFISATANCLKSNYFLLQSDCENVGNKLDNLRRATDNREIFQPPLVLISKGFGKVVFCDFPVLYQHSLQGIHGPKKDEDLLLFLTAYLRSDVARYYCFHTSSRWGIERDSVHLEELLRLPFFVPAEISDKSANDIVLKVANLMRTEHKTLKHLEKQHTVDEWMMIRQQRAETLHKKTNELIYRYFDLGDMERWLIKDTIHLFIPSSTPGSADTTDLPTLLNIDQPDSVPGYETGLAVYADALTTTLNTWAKELGSSLRLMASGGTDSQSGLTAVTLHLGKQAAEFKKTLKHDSQWKVLFDRFVREQITLREEKQLFWFEGNSLHIVRPSSLIHWTRTAALNDADHIFAQIQQMKGTKA